MILELATILFSATGVFTGTASCEKMSDGVAMRLHMRVESTNPRTPADSISRALARLSESVPKLALKKTILVLGESNEGVQYVRGAKSDDPTTWYASKELVATSRDFGEVQKILLAASEQGFQMTGSAEHFVDAKDSLNNACIEQAARNAVQRAEIGRKALGGKSMTIQKITDTESFGVYTSNDTRASDESVDDFFSSNTGRGAILGSRGQVRSGIEHAFFRISPEAIRVTASVKILVDIPVAP